MSSVRVYPALTFLLILVIAVLGPLAYDNKPNITKVVSDTVYITKIDTVYVPSDTLDIHTYICGPKMEISRTITGHLRCFHIN